MGYISNLTTDQQIQRISVDNDSRGTVFYNCLQYLNNITDNIRLKEDLKSGFGVNDQNYMTLYSTVTTMKNQIDTTLNNIYASTLTSPTVKSLVISAKTYNTSYHNKISSVLINWLNIIGPGNYVEGDIINMRNIYTTSQRCTVLNTTLECLNDKVGSFTSAQKTLLVTRLENEIIRKFDLTSELLAAKIKAEQLLINLRR